MTEIMLVVAAFIMIGLDYVVYVNNPLINILIWMLKLPVLLFEYFVLFWYWGGDGTFNFIFIPSCYILLNLVLFTLLRKHKENLRIRRTIINFMMFFTPLLCIGAANLVSMIFGFKIVIQ